MFRCARDGTILYRDRAGVVTETRATTAPFHPICTIDYAYAGSRWVQLPQIVHTQITRHVPDWDALPSVRVEDLTQFAPPLMQPEFLCVGVYKCAPPPQAR